jgi:exodeoxyribonuclease-3
VDTFRHFHSDANHYSWWTYRFGARERNVGWRIDYFFVNETFVEQLDDAEIHPDIMGSDHCPISLTLKRDSL